MKPFVVAVRDLVEQIDAFDDVEQREARRCGSITVTSPTPVGGRTPRSSRLPASRSTRTSAGSPQS